MINQEQLQILKENFGPGDVDTFIQELNDKIKEADYDTSSWDFHEKFFNWFDATFCEDAQEPDLNV